MTEGAEVEAALAELAERTGTARQRAVLSPALVLARAAEDHGYSVADLRGPERTYRVNAARRTACVRLRALGLSVLEIARLLDRDHTTVVYHLGKRNRGSGG